MLAPFGSNSEKDAFKLGTFLVAKASTDHLIAINACRSLESPTSLTSGFEDRDMIGTSPDDSCCMWLTVVRGMACYTKVGGAPAQLIEGGGGFKNEDLGASSAELEESGNVNWDYNLQILLGLL